MDYAIFAVFIFITLLSGVGVIKKVKKKYNPNRWLVAFCSPLLIIVPLIFIPWMPSFVWWGLIILFIWSNIYFFETTKELIESRKIRVGYKK